MKTPELNTTATLLVTPKTTQGTQPLCNIPHLGLKQRTTLSQKHDDSLNDHAKILTRAERGCERKKRVCAGARLPDSRNLFTGAGPRLCLCLRPLALPQRPRSHDPSGGFVASTRPFPGDATLAPRSPAARNHWHQE